MAFRMIGSALERILQSAPQLQMILARHTGLQGMQVAQTAAIDSTIYSSCASPKL
jgi:hypothetical protein